MKGDEKIKFKHFITLFVLAGFVIMITACGSNTENNDKTEETKQTDQKEAQETKEIKRAEDIEDEPDQDESVSEELQLTNLLPYQAGYTWKYDGSVEYGHQMHLNAIDENNEQAIYTVEGEVEDVSGGESAKDFSLNLIYTVTHDRLIQKLDSETMMDNQIPNIELIQTPLSEGHEWMQTQRNKEGREVTLKSSIESVRNDGEQKIYTVLYEDTHSDYYEKREIKEGVGVLSFEYLYKYENGGKEESIPLGYMINYQATGFDQN